MNKIRILGWILLLSTIPLGFLWADGSNDPFRYLVLTIVAINGALLMNYKDDISVNTGEEVKND